MRKKFYAGRALLFTVIAVGITAGSGFAAQKNQIAVNCKACHQEDSSTLWGVIKADSQKDDSFAVQVD
jgi:hypothetical protein